MSVKVKIKFEGKDIPAYATEGAAGMDIRANISERIKIVPGKRALIPTGIYLEIPEGYECQIRARSGLAVKNGIGLVNGIGTIDSDYRGEVKVALINWGEEDFVVENGDRIAQIILAKYEKINWEEVEALEDSERSAGGFGHTGRK